MLPIVFIGPTISPGEVSQVLEAQCWPPCAQGDIYRALRERPSAIGVIDGYFNGVASVWHKEILWAISEGVQVFGSSSMGALRAAELTDFGMIGVGEIYEDYRSGRTEDDDDVAVVHGPAELSYVSLSDPMANIRPTLDHAVASGVLSGGQAAAITTLAKSQSYPDRTWDKIMASAEAIVPGLPDRAEFSQWLRENHIDQKKNDALQLLETIRDFLESGQPVAQTGVPFERTLLWDQATTYWSAPEEPGADRHSVLEELLFSESAQSVRPRALARRLALNVAFEDQIEIDAGSLREANASFREQRGLFTAAALEAWLAANDLSREGLRQLLIEELCVLQVALSDRELLETHTVEVLKLEGRFQELAERGRHKLQVLASAGFDAAGARETGLHPADLRLWYFEQRLGQSQPVSFADYLAAHGLQSEDEFYTIVAREYLYLKCLDNSEDNHPPAAG